MYTYYDLSINQIDLIKNLWIKNKDYHSNISDYFRDNYGSLDFKGRFDSLSSKTDYKITVAETNNNIIGYIISIINGKQGEHLSFHVLESARGKGIGKSLLKQHIEWLQQSGVEQIEISVSYENQNTINFYKANGFKPDVLKMYL